MLCLEHHFSRSSGQLRLVCPFLLQWWQIADSADVATSCGTCWLQLQLQQPADCAAITASCPAIVSLASLHRDLASRYLDGVWSSVPTYVAEAER